jgi:hypothetical protein
MDRLEAIERLAKLRASGVLTEAEYNEQKHILMSSTSPAVAAAAAPAHTQFNREESREKYADHGSAPHIHIHNSNTQATQTPAYAPVLHPYLKSTLVAYLLWFFLFPISAHRLYLHRWASALVQIFWGVFAVMSALSGGLVMGVIFGSAASAVSGLFFFAVMMGIWGVWWLLDAILIPGMVDRYNQEHWRMV